MNDRDWDFGFSLEDENFVAPGKEQEIQAKVEDAEETLSKVIAMILPLLNNLMASPEKPTIYWPNRVEKVTEFKKALLKQAGIEE